MRPPVAALPGLLERRGGGGELASRANQREFDRGHRGAAVAGELALGNPVEAGLKGDALPLAQRPHRARKYGELLARQDRGLGIGDMTARPAFDCRPPLAAVKHAVRFAPVARIGLIKPKGATQDPVLVGGGGVERMQDLILHAAARKGSECSPLGPPGLDGMQEADARLLRDVVAVDAAGQREAANGRAQQRPVAAQQLLLRAPVVALGCQQQRALVKRGTASRSRGDHARPR